ncbi:MAG: peptidylprolyl isomerase [Candidatus Cloacimonetes bacterium]|nr:peptidylprolyl isomerase [Candidatus Cloacimonadota bacterium]
MKIILSIILLISSLTLSSQIIAEVGTYQISQQELSEEMNTFADVDDLTYKQVRQMALDNLIEKYILINYAEENNIEVDDVELEAFFMRELGDLPRFQTNGQFSVAKYRAFLETANGQSIKAEMEKEILVNKTRTLIRNSYNIADEQLLHQFLMEKIIIDLGYAIIDVEDANVTDNISLQEAERYYIRNRSKYAETKKVKLEFFLIFKDDYKDSVEITVQERLKKLSEMDSTLTLEDIEKLRSVFTLEEATERALNSTRQLLFQWSNDVEILIPILESPYLEIDEKIGNIPNEIIKQAFQMRKGEFSEPIDIGKAFIGFRVKNIKTVKNPNETEVANLVWKDFLEQKKRSFSDYREFFDNNIDKFTLDVAVVNIVNISEPPRFSSITKQEFVENVRSSIQENINDPYIVQDVLEKNGLAVNTRILYLETFENKNIVENVISNMVKNNSTYGFLPTTEGLVFFQVLSYFPSYIPRYEDIRDQMPNFIAISKTDTTEFREYYNEHKKDFMSPDSLKLGGVHFDISTIADTLNIEISEDELMEVYQKDIDSYYRKRSVKFDFIYVKDENMADKINDYLLQGYPFSLLKFSFAEPYRIKKINSEKNENIILDDPVQYDDLPRVLRESLSRMLEGSIYQPVHFDHGWFILNKIKEFGAGIIPFEEIKPEIAEELKQVYAEQIAYMKAKTIFDSTSYYSHLFKYLEDKDIFETEYQNANDDFEILGSLQEYKRDLMRVWRNEKFSSIIETENGFAVIFVLKKHSASQQTFEESLPAIESVIAANSRFENAKEFVNVLRDSIMKGENPDDLMLFFGGWKRARNLNLSSTIPGVNFSKDIMTDIINREENYCSPVIAISENQLLFYYIERYEKPDNTDFVENKEKFKSKYIDKRYHDWLSQYRAKLNIEIFN